MGWAGLMEIEACVYLCPTFLLADGRQHEPDTGFVIVVGSDMVWVCVVRCEGMGVYAVFSCYTWY